jgi:hypothetical protein
MAETLQFIDERLSNSITAIVPPADPIDRLQPLTFTDWLKYNTQLFTTTGEFLNRYQSYLNNWYAAKGASVEQASAGVQAYYTNLINEIVLNYTSDDEQRYLQNIDITNSRDLAIIVPFIAKKIKDICIYYSTLRDNVQTATLQYNLKGSNLGIENLLYVSFVNALQTKDIATKLNTLNLPISNISGNINIDIEDLYDTYTDYYDISPTLPASAYNVTTGLRNDFFSLNQSEIDPYLFLNINQSIVKAILSYPFYAIELGTNNFTIDPLVNSNQLNLLKDSDFISTVNDGNINNLNLQTISQEISKYIGTDFYYIATSTNSTFTSGVLFTANNDYANFLNKRYPTIAAVPSQEFLKTEKEIGLFFKPDKIGIANFTNFNFTSKIDLAKLQPNSVYYFPDPSKYGNISGNTKLDFQSPLTFLEENYFNKIDYSNQYRMGDVISDPYFQTFRAYQTREQTLNYTDFGIQRYADPQDFFTGNQDTIWSNIDVYPLALINQFPIDQRESTLLPINKTLVQFKSDIYGNQYGLYKSAVNKQFNTITYATKFLDFVFDSFVFNLTAADVNWPGWYVAKTNVQNVNYIPYGTTLNYSGVVLKTSIDEHVDSSGNIPIYNAQPTTTIYGTSYLDNGATFNDGGIALVLESYDFKTNDTAYGYANPDTYDCSVGDGVNFTKPDNTLLPDVPSDQSGYTPTDSYLYYNTLADGAPQPNSPIGVANFTNQAQFLSDSINNFYITDTYDGGAFWDYNINAGPCDVITYNYQYNEPTNFINARLANTDTVLDQSLSGINATKNSLYYTKNIEHGEFYFRNANSTFTGPLSTALSAVFASLPSDIQNEVYSNTINFDVYFDTLQIETENYLIFNKLQYDYDVNAITTSRTPPIILNRGNQSELEKFSSVWFDEGTNLLTVAATTLHRDNLSASNYKAIYPTIYILDLVTEQISQIFPQKNDNDLTFNELSAFSLYGKGLELNIVRIEKPTLNYSKETGLYTLTYLGKDTANCFYIITTRFQYTQNAVHNITCTIHKPSTDVYNINFSNQLPNKTRVGSPYLNTYTAVGSAAGRIDINDNTYTWGYDVNV